jgi:hypothetical protein
MLAVLCNTSWYAATSVVVQNLDPQGFKTTVGGHLVPVQRCRSETDIGTSDIGLKRAKSARILGFGINLIYFVISDITCCKDYLSGCVVMHSPEYSTGMGFIPANMKIYIYLNLSDIGMDSDVDGLFGYQNVSYIRYQMSMLDVVIADKRIYADVHLCKPQTRSAQWPESSK